MTLTDTLGLETEPSAYFQLAETAVASRNESHLLNLSPVTLWHSFFMPASSVTVLNSEKRYHGQAAFRLQAYGDTSHLRMEGERVSGFGAFSTVFSK